MSGTTATPSHGPVAPRPARHQDAVVFTCDAGHLPYAWAAADRITRMEPQRRFDVVVASPDIDRVPPHLRDGAVRLLHIAPVLPQIGITNARITLAAYFRYLLPGLLRNDYRALLYCDTDTSLRRPGIQSLFNAISKPFGLAAVPDFTIREALRPHRSAKGRAHAARLRATVGAPDGSYWQSGILLFQNAVYEAEGIAQGIIAFAAANQELMARDRLGDQDGLNAGAAHLVVPLSPRWNWHNYRWLRPDLVRRFDPFVLHFSGNAKPWMLTDHPLAAEVTGDWHAALRRWNPGFVPSPHRGSLAFAAANPPTGIRAADMIVQGLRRLGQGVGRAMPAKVGRDGMAEMQRLIDTADIG